MYRSSTWNKWRQFMNTKRDITSTSAVVLVLSISLGGSAALAADAGRYPNYAQPPTPEKLAEILFPAQFRSAEHSNTIAQPRQFGMMVNFEFDSSDIQTDSQPALNAVGQMLTLERIGSRPIVIEGHTDSIGGAAYNQGLSLRRAKAVKSYLMSRFGVLEQRLVVLGKGEGVLYDESNPKSAMNRRVVFRPAQKLASK